MTDLKRKGTTIKRGISAIMLVLLLNGGIVINAPADAPIVGEWSGTVSEKDEVKYTVNVKINPGAQSGSVEFTQYPCGGSLSLVSSSGNQYLYQERLSFGVEKCINNLQARLAYRGKDEVYFEELLNGTAAVWGILYRTSPPLQSGCIQDKKPFFNDHGFTILRFFNNCNEPKYVFVCVKSIPPGDKAVFNPKGGNASPKAVLEITAGMTRHFRSYEWDEERTFACE